LEGNSRRQRGILEGRFAPWAAGPKGENGQAYVIKTANKKKTRATVISLDLKTGIQQTKKKRVSICWGVTREGAKGGKKTERPKLFLKIKTVGPSARGVNWGTPRKTDRGERGGLFEKKVEGEEREANSRGERVQLSQNQSLTPGPRKIHLMSQGKGTLYEGGKKSTQGKKNEPKKETGRSKR